MSWLYLIIAGIFEVGWPLGFKLASTYTKYNIIFVVLSVISMALSGVFLYIAQKSIPIGTAYVIWTGVGAVGTLLIGILFFGDSADFWRLFFITLIIIGIIGTKIVHE
ncbi:MAG: SMR family transporter [Candidatus Mucispirillum faecigallinarum]|uniref:Guanidinium exporter n=1 Tax=Candidatus Mucispirillum faecigallinarum TaxID=2838699 RepID=A0A9D2KDU9_9BACT|nr:SMR family transporter [Mucispirillum sp.]MDY5051237.1 SMR family transporter [Candidatus Mucispirillum faecigallinarum]HIZ90413.1 QacE family quaternary ammonium compound efflux SMR transporter [Candidatus Mucispirillum faecigallinarum]